MRVGMAGGYSAAFSTMHALGLAPYSSTSATLLQQTRAMAPASASGRSVVILGGGISGLVSAYELRKLGYKCTVLEARNRPGGRNWTLRDGDTVRFTDGTKQNVSWRSGNYMNAGPARLPSIHKTMLGYCRELGVPLEVEVNTTRSSLMLNRNVFDGKPVEQRAVINDMRGYISELLAKCVNKKALNEDLSADDQEKLLAFLRTYGDLGANDKFIGSERSGLSQWPGAGLQEAKLRAPLEFKSLLNSRFWPATMFEEENDMQATMFQPVGGMDRIPHAFAAKLDGIVQYGTQVTEIRRTTRGVRIGYTHKGAHHSIAADYCFCALPLTILQKTPNDFSPQVKQAISQTSYDDAFKIAWEAQRFWERDNNIYGGISWITDNAPPEWWLSNDPISLIWYPSGHLFSETGVLIGGYAVENKSPLSKLNTIQKKLDASRLAIERLHPGRGKELDKPIYINWGRIPFNEGSWVSDATPAASQLRSIDYYKGPYNQLIQPDGPFFFVGDHCSHIIGWQEGAALSSLRAIQQLGEQTKAASLRTGSMQKSTV